MIWSTIFLISIAQALFLLSLLLLRKGGSRAAANLIGALLAVMILPNLNHLSITAGFYKMVPGLYGISFGFILLAGPLFYLYAKTITDSAFKWKWLYLAHFAPYVIYILLGSQFYFAGNDAKLLMADLFAAGNLPVYPFTYFLFSFQAAHFSLYLYLSFRQISSAGPGRENVSYVVSMAAREKWLGQLMACFAALLAVLLCYYIFLFAAGRFSPTGNYIYTLVTSSVIYFIAYKLVLDPALISPDFTRKYRDYMQFDGEAGARYLQKLESLMTEAKVFTNPDLKLASLSEELGLPAHQVSKLINEKFGRSFKDLVNEYRVREFILCMNDPRYRSRSMYGIALDVGFNSKSSFNTVFKKVTGKTPSEYKTASL
jgi:AraC-like DNA-binding protein